MFHPNKTRRDHESGAHDRRLQNRAERTAWMKGQEDKFPAHTCNGKKNRVRDRLK